MTLRLVGPQAPAESPQALTLEPLLTARQVATILGVSVKRVYELSVPTVRISERSLRWSRADLETWIAERRGVA
jgi:predicted DNA-binding transcriptional regulator AlpA